MEPIAFLEQFGIPLSVDAAFGYFIWKQNQFIQNDLSQDLKEKFERLEGIIIGLINAQKKHSIDLKGLTKSYQTIVDVITKIIKKENK